MKKTLVLLLSFIIGFSTLSASAQTTLDELGLPADYEKWPYTAENSCPAKDKTLITSLFGKFDAVAKEAHVIVITKIDSEIFFVMYAGGSVNGPRFTYEYLPSITGSKKYDTVAEKDYTTITELLDKHTPKVLGMTKDEVSNFFMNKCTQVNYQINDLALKIFRENLK